MKLMKLAALSALVGLSLASCSKKASLDTTEKFVAAYEEAHKAGTDEVLKLVYKSDQIPEKMLTMMKESMEGERSMTIKSVKVEPFEDENYEQSLKVMKEAMNVTMPIKPTHYVVVSYEDKGDVSDFTSSTPIAKIEDSFYIIAPIKAE